MKKIEISESGRELYIKDDFAEIREIKDVSQNNENTLRFYMTSAPNGFNLQIRTFKPIVSSYTTRGKAKPRNMIATIGLSFDEIEALYVYAKQQRQKYE